MALPGPGNSISISQIRNELINSGSSYSLRQLSAWAGKSTPDAMSEFYGYSACPAYGTYYSSYCSGYDLYYRYHNGSCGYYDSLYQSNSTTCGYTACTTWYAGYSGYFSYTDCNGTYQYTYIEANGSVCAQSSGGGMVNSGNACFGYA
jgi:hypothetical protein